jgi:polysaccharide biosynthesis/export protein
MKSLTHLTSLVFLVITLFVCGSLFGQTANAGHDIAESSGAAAAAPPAQPDALSRSARPDGDFIIGNDDVLAINVWKEPDLTRQLPVRSDGKISLPLIGDVQAAGRTPTQLEQDITDKLKAFITDPQVAVIVQQINSLKFNILGEVVRPGSYPLTSGMTIVDAIAAAGGFKDFAKKKGIYVLRQNTSGSESRYEFNYNEFIKGKNTKQNITLKQHDTVIIP